jgi:hypothetical protein
MDITKFPDYEGATAYHNDWFDLTGEWETVTEGVRCRTIAFKETPVNEVDGAFVEILPGYRTPIQLVRSDHVFTEAPFGGDLSLFHVDSSGNFKITKFDPNLMIDGEIAIEVKKGDLMFWYCDVESLALGEVVEYEIPGFNSAELPTVDKHSAELKGTVIPDDFWKAADLINSHNYSELKILVASIYNGDIRFDRLFGKGKLFPEGTDLDQFFALPFERQAEIMGWSHACPVVDSVIREYGKEWASEHPEATEEQIFEQGAVMTLRRYAECNFVYGMILDNANKNNIELAEAISTPVQRLEGEPFGIENMKYVPDSY